MVIVRTFDGIDERSNEHDGMRTTNDPT